MSAKLARKAKDTLQRNRSDAIDLVQDVGLKRMKLVLEDAKRDLEKRLSKKLRGGGKETFTAVQMKVTLAQIKDVLVTVNQGIKDAVVGAGKQAAEQSAQHTIDYLYKADKAFRGVGQQGLSLKTSFMFERATQKVESSILHRLSSKKTKQRKGILQRYDEETIKHFEHLLRRGMIAKKSFNEMRDDITGASTFLQDAPAYWATRIVRTETMGAYNRASWHSIREADDQLGDMTKILSATFDDRTAADSYAVHGQIRYPEEPFESWYGLYQHPPNRPNDREVVVPHRISWEIPDYLQFRDEEEVLEQWHLEGHKQPMLERPEMTTVDLSLFGQSVSRLKGRHREEVDDDEDD